MGSSGKIGQFHLGLGYVYVLMFCKNTCACYEMFDVDNVTYLNYLNNSLCIVSVKLKITYIYNLMTFVFYFQNKSFKCKHSASLHVFIAVILEKQ